jgi:uncharacterized protein
LFRTIVAASLFLASVVGAKSQDIQFFTFGAGDVSGGYYAAASAICETVNRNEQGLFRCSPDPTPGSIYNLNALRNGELDFALVQSDWHRRAFFGTGQYASKGRMENLRSVMGLYGETLTIVARRDAGIGSIGDLSGKRIDVGHPASGRRATVDQILQVLGFKYPDFAEVAELPVGTALEALCNKDIDATLLIVGHPNAGVERMLNECDAVLVPVTEESSSAIIAALPDMKKSVIALENYSKMTAAIPSVAVTATVVTRADVDPAIVGSLVKNTLANLEILARNAPVLKGLDPKDMAVAGLTAPLHPAAKEAFALSAGH